MRPLRSRSRSAIPKNPSARMCSRRWRATTRACAGPRSRSTTGRRQGRARPHHHPAGCARSHRADRIAAILDHRLGRAAEPRDQLSHRVHRGAEQPAPGRLYDAPAHGRCRVASGNVRDDNGFGSFFQRGWEPQTVDPRPVDPRPVDPRRRRRSILSGAARRDKCRPCEAGHDRLGIE